jgi:hypothetical protein
MADVHVSIPGSPHIYVGSIAVVLALASLFDPTLRFAYVGFIAVVLALASLFDPTLRFAYVGLIALRAFCLSEAA